MTTEREAFEARFSVLDFSRGDDIWGREEYLHAHVQSLWHGWQARAELAAPVAEPVAIDNGKIQAIFKKNCVHYAGNYEVTPGQAHCIARQLSSPPPAPASAWQPIESAPKDGTKILAWSNGCKHWVASWRLPVRGEPQNESHYVLEWRDGGGSWATPTHWMPLPLPSAPTTETKT